MKKFLLTTTAIIALGAQVHFARAADPEPVGHVDFPTTFISFEGGYIFNASPENVDFADDDEKLGDLRSLQPGQGGWQGRFELGQRFNSNWDFKVGLSMLRTGVDESRAGYQTGIDGEQLAADLEAAIEDLTGQDINVTFPTGFTLDETGEARAQQKTNLEIVDFEVGYRPDDLGQVQTRLFAGVRGLHARTVMDWETNGLISVTPDADDPLPFEDVTKMGDINDTVYALGPRIGADVMVPLDSHDVAFVGSASGSLLFGNTESDADGTAALLQFGDMEWSDMQTIWNVEGMAGLAIGVGENANLTLGYRVAQFGNLVTEHSGVRRDSDKTGDVGGTGSSDLLVHGPFARLTVEIP